MDEELERFRGLGISQEDRRLGLLMPVMGPFRLDKNPFGLEPVPEVPNASVRHPAVDHEGVVADGEAKRGLRLVDFDFEGLLRRDDECSIFLPQRVETALDFFEALLPLLAVGYGGLEEVRRAALPRRDLELGE